MEYFSEDCVELLQEKPFSEDLLEHYPEEILEVLPEEFSEVVVLHLKSNCENKCKLIPSTASYDGYCTSQ